MLANRPMVNDVLRRDRRRIASLVWQTSRMFALPASHCRLFARDGGGGAQREGIPVRAHVSRSRGADVADGAKTLLARLFDTYRAIRRCFPPMAGAVAGDGGRMTWRCFARSATSRRNDRPLCHFAIPPAHGPVELPEGLLTGPGPSDPLQPPPVTMGFYK